MILIDVTNPNLIISSIPESLGLLVFGFCLIGATVGLRRLIKRHEQKKRKTA